MNKIAIVQGFKVNLLNFEEVMERLFGSDCAIHVVTINPEIIQSAKKNAKLKQIIDEAEIVTADGVGIKIALRLKGIYQEQVTGVDLSRKILENCAKIGEKVALVGAKSEVLSLAVQNIKEKYEGINIAYAHDGYFQDFEPIIDEILNSGAKFVLCAMGSPRQEYFISELKKRGKWLVMIGVGGTFDVLSGTVKEAPQIYKKLGLEWLYRTIKQPERIKRIFPALPIFFFQSIMDMNRNKE